MGRNNRPTQARRRYSVFSQAHFRGVVAVRRSLSADSYELMDDYVTAIHREVIGDIRLFEPEDLTVSVISLSRMTSHHKKSGPPTSEIAATYDIRSRTETIAATIGALAVVGGGKKFKLALTLESDELRREESEFTEAFQAAGYPLRREYNSSSENEAFLPHCSLGLLFNEYVPMYRYGNLTERLDVLAGAIGQTILLDPPSMKGFTNE